MRLAGLAGGGASLVDAPPEWPRLRVVAELADPGTVRERVTETHAVLPLKTGGRLALDRERRIARYTVPRALTDDELVHPFLAPAAAVFAHWEGRLSFHAGAFVAGGGVWAVVGGREAGKSSTLAWMALHGHDVFADDVLVLDGVLALAGPRAIDLREDAAARLGAGTALGILGARPRWRIGLPQAPAQLPFHGWMFLRWADRPETRRLRASECLQLLTETLTVRLDAPDPRALLDLAALPAFSVRRARDWDRLEADVDRIVELTR
jgi:hypothetical protein